jgi:hypothetical protein
MTWSAFDESIVLPNRGKLVTLLDAGEYISALPKRSIRRRSGKPRWTVDFGRGRWKPTMFARIGSMRALNGH